MSYPGYSGTNYDRYVERTETSTIHKMKETFWTTKQAVIQKLGKKEDEHVVASDSQLDSKLEVFKAIQKSCMELLRTIEKYQDRLCALSQEENAMGRFLKSNSGADKTRAGKMMAAVGKSQSFAAQQRLALRVPLVRLYQEVETFRYRAISDTLMTINRMEGARTEYRGALLWMKAVSEELDPDTYKQLEKFRKVQAQVRKTKARFDKLKLDVMQKVDLLAASRCNMFSHVLANYQSSLLHFWEKTSRTMTAVAESFKGYQYYEFSIVKELAEPSKKLAEETSRREPAERDVEEEEFDPEKLCRENSVSSDESQLVEESPSDDERTRERYIWIPQSFTLISFGDQDEGKEEKAKSDQKGSLNNLYEGEKESKETADAKSGEVNQIEDKPLILDFGEDTKDIENSEDFDFTGKVIPLEIRKTPIPKEVPKDLLSEDLNFEPDDSEKDDMTVLNEILNAPSTGEDDFTREWQAVFGHTPLTSGTTYTPVETDQSQNPAEFMPSSLLDMNKQMGDLSLSQGISPGIPPITSPQPASPTPQEGAAATNPQPNKPKSKTSKKSQKSDMSAWFNLFADLDPLSNPDAIGKQTEDMTDAQL